MLRLVYGNTTGTHPLPVPVPANQTHSLPSTRGSCGSSSVRPPFHLDRVYLNPTLPLPYLFPSQHLSVRERGPISTPSSRYPSSCKNLSVKQTGHRLEDSPFLGHRWSLFVQPQTSRVSPEHGLRSRREQNGTLGSQNFLNRWFLGYKNPSSTDGRNN